MVILVILSICFNKLYCQKLNIKGFVYDTLTNEPISFVNICIKGTTVGTVTNSNGFYSLNIPPKYNNGVIVFSFIGYNTKEYSINKNYKKLTVNLKKALINIEEVVVNPDSNMFTLLKKAYEKIPQNYPADISKLTGFYRETLQQKDKIYLYVAEAAINNYNTSYKNKQMGQVEIIKSRKNILPRIDTILNVKAYGGLFTVQDYDIVHNRSGVINPRNFKKYNYNYLGILQYGNRFVYTFSYNRINKEVVQNGKFYIDIQTLAYVYFENTKEGNWRSNIYYIINKRETSKILYTQQNDIWYPKSIIVKYEFLNSHNNKAFEINSDYVTTSFNNTDIKPLKFNNQLRYTDILSDIATSYEKSYWKDFIIIEQDSLNSAKIKLNFSTQDADNFLKTEHKHTKTFLDYYIQLFSHLYFDYNFSATDYSFDVKNIQVMWQDNIVYNNTINTNEKKLSLGIAIGYKLTKKLAIEYKLNTNKFNDIYHQVKQYGLNYLIPLKRVGKQFFAQPSISYFNSYGGHIIGFVDMPNPTTIDKKVFKKGGANIYTGKKYQGISTGIIFKTNITKMLHFVVGANYYFPVTTTDMCLLKEDSGLFEEKAYQPFNNDIEYYEDGERRYSSSFELNNWSINAGIRFEF